MADILTIFFNIRDEQNFRVLRMRIMGEKNLFNGTKPPSKVDELRFRETLIA